MNDNFSGQADAASLGLHLKTVGLFFNKFPVFIPQMGSGEGRNSEEGRKEKERQNL